MTTKTRDFQLNEENTFKNEIIHFFNINAKKSTIYIYLEIDGKKMKSEKNVKSYHKLILKDLALKIIKKEINCLIFEDAELKILMRLIRKFTKYLKRKSKSVDKPEKEKGKEANESPNNNISPEKKSVKIGMSVKDKIKLFSGEVAKTQINNDKILPGRLIMPKIFQNESEDKIKNKEHINNFDQKEDKSKIINSDNNS